MTKSANTDLWRGGFGDEYTQRNESSEENINDRTQLLYKIISNAKRRSILSIAEVGAGGGGNIKALKQLRRDIDGFNPKRLIAIDPNAEARTRLRRIKDVEVLDGTAEEIPLPDDSVDLVMTSGVLIHIPPENLGAALDELHRVSSKYILMIEYFSPTLECRKYQGLDEALWRGDYGSMFLDRKPDAFGCLAYGFAWKRITGMDNVTWWLMRK